MKDFDNPKYYFNRELSWLKFNQRVLQESSYGKTAIFNYRQF